MTAIKYRTADVDGFKIFYREAGAGRRAEAAAAARLPERRPHVPRPDPAAGRSLPHRRARPAGLRQVRHAGAAAYTFDRIAETIDRFTEVVGFDRYAVYVFDYGAPTGFRLAVKHPDRITAIISQNGNAYEEGLSDGWNPIRAYWQDAVRRPTARRCAPSSRPRRRSGNTRTACPTRRRSRRTATRSTTSTSPGPAPTRCSSTCSATTRATSRSTRPSRRISAPTSRRFLAVWGKNDPFFLPPGAEAFKRDIPDAVVRFFDTGHFALETHAAEIAAAIRDFLSR